jgi:hypothetical protein
MKFGDTTDKGKGGYKLLRRFYGVSDTVVNMAIPEAGTIDQTYTGKYGVTPSGTPGMWGDTALGPQTNDTNWWAASELGNDVSGNGTLYSKAGALESVSKETREAAKDLALAWAQTNPNAAKDKAYGEDDPLLVTSGVKDGAHSGGTKIDVCASSFEQNLKARQTFIDLAISKGWRVGNEYNPVNLKASGGTAGHIDLEWTGKK